MNKKNIKIIFTEEADPVFDNIIKKYNLQETDTQAWEKFQKNKDANVIIVDRLSIDFAEEKITEKQFAESLKKDLGIDPQTAEKLSKEIKTNLIPLLEKVPEKKIETREPEEPGDFDLTPTPPKHGSSVEEKIISTPKTPASKGALQKMLATNYAQPKPSIPTIKMPQKNTAPVPTTKKDEPDIKIGTREKITNEPAVEEDMYGAPKKIPTGEQFKKEKKGSDSYREPIE